MRTKTYLAADFDHDKDAIDILYDWKKNKYLDFDFQDAHDLTQSRDSSLYCSIKKSLRYRLGESKTFVLIVGEHTNSITKGKCQFCSSYNSHNSYCARGHEAVDFRSYIQYESDIAEYDYFHSDLNKIIVLYKSTSVDKKLCPENLRTIGVHIPMIYYSYIDKEYHWDYDRIKKAFN